MKLKYVFAAVLGIAFGLVTAMAANQSLGPFHACALAVFVSLVCARLTNQVGQVNLLVMIGSLIVGGVLFWGFELDRAAYLLIIGLGFLAGTLGTLLAGNGRSDPFSDVYRSRGH